MYCIDDSQCYGGDVCCDFSCVAPVLNSCYGKSCNSDFDCFGDFTCCTGGCYHQSSVFCDSPDNLAEILWFSVAGAVFFIILIVFVTVCVRRRRTAAMIATTNTVVAVSASTTGQGAYAGTGQTDPNLHSQYYPGTYAPPSSGYYTNPTSTAIHPPPPYQADTLTTNTKSPLLN